MAGSGDRDNQIGIMAYVRDIVGSALAVFLIGAILFGVSGVWPPMVAIESGSMEPHIEKGDLVFVMEEHRFPGDGSVTYQGENTGVVTYQAGERTDYKKFSQPGDVIIYKPDGESAATPIIHRARFWVNDSENWYDKANPDYLSGADNCDELEYCPAPYAGFITKGDNQQSNGQYDQLSEISGPVKPSWVVGTAEFRIPLLGFIRLGASAVSGVGFGSQMLYTFAGVVVLGATAVTGSN